MLTKVVEFHFAPLSRNVLDHRNPFSKQKMMLGYRDLILQTIGRGPWPKAYLKRKMPAALKKQIREKERKDWAPKRMVFAVAAVHRSGRFYDQDGNAGGFKPIWDALQWAGWCVTDSKKWFKYVHLDQQRGEDHTLIKIYVPETDEEEEYLTEKFKHPFEGEIGNV